MLRKFSWIIVVVFFLAVFVLGAILSADESTIGPFDANRAVQTDFPNHMLHSKTAELLFSRSDWNVRWDRLTNHLDRAYAEIAEAERFPKEVSDDLFMQMFRALGINNGKAADCLEAYFNHVQAFSTAFAVERQNGKTTVALRTVAMVVDFNPLDVFQLKTFGTEGVDYRVLRSDSQTFILDFKTAPFPLTLGGTKIAGTSWYAIAAGSDPDETLRTIVRFGNATEYIRKIKDTSLLKEIVVPGETLKPYVVDFSDRRLADFCDRVEPIHYSIRARNNGSLLISAAASVRSAAGSSDDAQALYDFASGAIDQLRSVADSKTETQAAINEMRAMLDRFTVRMEGKQVIAEFIADVSLLDSVFDRFCESGPDRLIDQTVEAVKNGL